jgi:hypothetical protein
MKEGLRRGIKPVSFLLGQVDRVVPTAVRNLLGSRDLGTAGDPRPRDTPSAGATGAR